MILSQKSLKVFVLLIAGLAAVTMIAFLPESRVSAVNDDLVSTISNYRMWQRITKDAIQVPDSLPAQPSEKVPFDVGQLTIDPSALGG